MPSTGDATIPLEKVTVQATQVIEISGIATVSGREHEVVVYVAAKNNAIVAVGHNWDVGTNLQALTGCGTLSKTGLKCSGAAHDAATKTITLTATQLDGDFPTAGNKSTLDGTIHY